jgi:transcription-repair coupling factor (superfamily II helicase)
VPPSRSGLARKSSRWRWADLLVDAGFTREDPVDEHGAFTLRGGIVDVYPAGDAEPTRLEFVGDMVESLRRFDPATQRSTGAIDYLLVAPVRERFDDDEEPLTVIEFLASSDVRLLVSEYDQVAEQARKVRDQLQASFSDASARGHVAALPPSRAFIAWEDIEGRAAAASRLEELGIEEPGVRQVACQPAMEFRGRVNDWIAEVRQARQRGDAVLFVAESPGRAERTVEILQEYDVLAVPVERAEDAHPSSVLVAVGSLTKGFRLADAGLQIYAETDVFDEEHHAPEQRRNLARTFLSDLRTSRSVTSSSTWITGLANSSASNSSTRPAARWRLRARRSSSSSGTTAMTSCSSRSNAWT